jgi:hypothetical protein
MKKPNQFDSVQSHCGNDFLQSVKCSFTPTAKLFKAASTNYGMWAIEKDLMAAIDALAQNTHSVSDGVWTRTSPSGYDLPAGF